ncbi:hypothetical protein [Paraflavitalea sp. CAU 1676]|uniref:tetratricopeptide repeat protein n=1 Tax=Paraflavitalea sp. CAU 1676 TaxID=3032598 RepID=UPI0023DBE527|nr:hypothetical protein [Paraflavitalea sp. CAU 1676]MDF2193621.1 hypothetical protein [Paraflavitalea sp. CAU 1676]
MRSSYVMGFALCIVSVVIMLEAYDSPALGEETAGRAITIFCSPSLDLSKLKAGNAPLIKGLGNLHFEISTRSKQAQRYFDQGLMLMYAFNHGEAARSFLEVTRLDSSAAMGWWGMAMVLGPNYNAALNPSSLEEINKSMTNAKQHEWKASAKEKWLINALLKRYPAEPVSEMAPFHAAYAAAMKQAYEQFSQDADVATLYADAMMNEHPWNLYSKDGKAQPWTPGIEQLLEATMKRHPNHPGALHLYIHAVEASSTASRGLPAARKLLNLVPAAGHLVHMPAHIYIRTGHYHDGVQATELAQVSDSSYIAQCKSQGTYPLLYFPHNIHFLAACAFLEGNSKKAMEAAWSVSRHADRRYLATNGTVQHYYSIPFYVLVHLGKWEDILSIPAPGGSLQYPTAIWHYARGMAFTARGKWQEATAELKKLKAYAGESSLRSLLIWETNSALDLISIAALTLEAEMLAFGHQYDQAIALLQQAVVIEDKLNYQEPPDWFFSVRHSLGHVLLQAKRFTEAEAIYRDDLKILPENGWALMGLLKSLEGQERNADAELVRQRFEKAWQWADISLTSSRKY